MIRTIYTTPKDAEAAFYEAIEKGDLEAMMGVWSDDEEIVCIHPSGARLTGVEQIRESWRQIFASGQSLRFRLVNQQFINGMTLAVHSVYENIIIGEETRPRSPMIATNIYMRTANGWRMVVHHASPAPPGPETDGRRPSKTLH